MQLVNVPVTIDTSKRNISERDGNPENLIDRCFTLFLKIMQSVGKKHLRLGAISMQTKIKLFKAIKGVFNWCKLQVIFKSQNKICDNVIT